MAKEKSFTCYKPATTAGLNCNNECFENDRCRFYQQTPSIDEQRRQLDENKARYLRNFCRSDLEFMDNNQEFFRAMIRHSMYRGEVEVSFKVKDRLITHLSLVETLARKET